MQPSSVGVFRSVHVAWVEGIEHLFFFCVFDAHLKHALSSQISPHRQASR